MPRFSTRSLFRNKSMDEGFTDDPVPEDPTSPDTGDDTVFDSPIDTGGTEPPIEDTGDGSGDTSGDIESPVEDTGEPTEESSSQSQQSNPLLPQFPTSLAPGTFSLPGSKTFRQYQSPEERDNSFGGIADDIIGKRLRKGAKR